MESIDFRSLSERLRTELSRVYFWQKIVRILSIIVYLFVFCWMMFVQLRREGEKNGWKHSRHNAAHDIIFLPLEFHKRAAECKVQHNKSHKNRENVLRNHTVVL